MSAVLVWRCVLLGGSSVLFWLVCGSRVFCLFGWGWEEEDVRVFIVWLWCVVNCGFCNFVGIEVPCVISAHWVSC